MSKYEYAYYDSERRLIAVADITCAYISRMMGSSNSVEQIPG